MGAHGGSRPGAGRRSGSGKYGGEPTRLVRVPTSLLSSVVTRLDEYRNAKALALLGARSMAIEPPRQEVRAFSLKVPAGSPGLGDEAADERCDLNQLLVRDPESTFLYPVAGDSMDRAGILHGDQVVVDRALEAGSGDIVVAILPGEGHTLKRLRLQRGLTVLEPDSHNPRHKARRLRPDEELQIWGVVRAVIRRYKR